MNIRHQHGPEWSTWHNAACACLSGGNHRSKKTQRVTDLMFRLSQAQNVRNTCHIWPRGLLKRWLEAQKGWTKMESIDRIELESPSN